MFLDVGNEGPNGFWEKGPVCKSCKRLIDDVASAEDLRFDMLADERFEGMDGLYHGECARPYLTMMRALSALRRFSR